MDMEIKPPPKGKKCGACSYFEKDIAECAYWGEYRAPKDEACWEYFEEKE